MTNFNEADKDAFLSSIDIKDIIQSITLADVKHFLETLGVEQIVVNEEKQYLICPTICHNPLHEAESMKLYWYQNNKIFRCYTECNEAMSIFELYRKYMDLNYYPITLDEAKDYVKHCLTNVIHFEHSSSLKNWNENFEKYKFSTNLPILPEYSKTVLDYFTSYCHPSWLKDGITPEVMKKFQIKFWLSQNKIIIPHFDINNRLVGIRGRALEPQEIEECGKYRPIQIGNTLYTYPLQFNLYGLNFHKEAINKRGCAIIAEAEKSVMLDEVYYGNLSNTVACCGSSFNKYHISLLTNFAHANEIVIALDKEYDNWRSEKARKYREKIESMCRKFNRLSNFSYIWDFDDLLEEKDSPFDKGKEVFDELFKNRIKVR